jgi:hypothetical protein
MENIYVVVAINLYPAVLLFLQGTMYRLGPSDAVTASIYLRTTLITLFFAYMWLHFDILPCSRQIP